MRWNVVIGAAALALLAGGALAWTTIRQDREFQRLIAAGDQALSADQTVVAIEAFSGAVALERDSMIAYLKRGDTYRRRGDFAAALRDLEQAAALEPTAPKPLELLGDVHLAMGRYGPAAVQYARFTALDDQSARLFYKQALATYRDGRPGMAIAIVRQALALDDRLAEGHYLLGMSLAAEGQPDVAVTALRRAVEISPAFSAAREELAVLYTGRGRTRDAIEELEALAALEPARPERLANVGLAFARAGRSDAAIQTLGRAVERYPDEQVVYAALGRVWLDEAAQGDPVALGNAVTAFEAAIAHDGATGPTLAMFGRALLLAGDLPRAEGVLQQATARLPVEPRAYRDLAEAARRLGHHAVAQDAARRFAALANTAP